MAFTGNKDVDRTILLGLDDYDLANICQTNRYFKSLCSEELLWKLKTLKRFSPYLGSEFLISQYMKQYNYKTWKSYYISLRDFLEFKYESFGKFKVLREDTKKLNNIINTNNHILVQNIHNFLESLESPKIKESHFESLKIFMDQLLSNDMLNPNCIFEELLNGKYDKILESLIKYMLNSKDKRIHIEYSDNMLLKKIAEYDNPYDHEGRTFKMLLDNSHIDPNSFLDEIITSNFIIPIHVDIIFSDPRVTRETIKKAIEEAISLDTSPEFLIKISEKFLHKGGSLLELEEMYEKITRSESFLVPLKDFIEKYKSLNKIF
jgi:hypothetical protein